MGAPQEVQLVEVPKHVRQFGSQFLHLRESEMSPYWELRKQVDSQDLDSSLPHKGEGHSKTHSLVAEYKNLGSLQLVHVVDCEEHVLH